MSADIFSKRLAAGISKDNSFSIIALTSENSFNSAVNIS